MNAVKVQGYNGFTLESQDYKFQRERGWYLQQIWKGPLEKMWLFMQSLDAVDADQISATTGNPAIIVIDTPYAVAWSNEVTQAIQDAIWELIPEPVDKILSSHPVFKVGAGKGYLAEIDRAIDSGDMPTITQNWDTKYTDGGGKLDIYRDLRMGGTDTYESGVWRVRQTIVVSRKSAYQANAAAAWTVLTWDHIGVPANSKFICPVVSQWTGETFEPMALADWLDMGTEVTWNRNQHKWHISREWVGSVMASGTIYKGGTGP